MGALTPYRPYFIAFALAMLAWTFYRHLKNRISAVRGPGAALSALFPRSSKDFRLYLGAGVVILLIFFPVWGRSLLAVTP